MKECCLFLARHFLMTNNRTKKYITLTVLNAFKMCSKYGENCTAIYERMRVSAPCAFLTFAK